MMTHLPDIRLGPATSLLSASPSDDPAIRLCVVEKCPASPDPVLPPLLIIHGATLSGRVFDLPRSGYSLMESLSAEGRVVYTLDIRGFGRSSAPRVMDQPPGHNPPFGHIDEAMLDLAAAVDAILARRSVPALDLAGFSWGASLAARFAGQSAGRVRRIALYAPIYRQANLSALGTMGRSAENVVPHEAYGWISADDMIRRWDSGLPGNDPADYREPDVANLLFETIAALDARASTHRPPAFRCPRGPLADLAKVAGGQTLFDPAALSMPTLIIRGSDDTTSGDRDCRELLKHIASPAKTYDAIAPGSHFLLLERNRAVLYDRLNSFFTRQAPA